MRFKELLLTAAALVALGCSKESKEDSQTKTVSLKLKAPTTGPSLSLSQVLKQVPQTHRL